jgi:hypothetical protein
MQIPADPNPPFRPLCQLWPTADITPLGLSPLCADIVAKVPNRQELIFLLLKKSTDDR